MAQANKPGRIATILRQPPVLTLQSLLRRIPLKAIEIAPFCILRLDDVSLPAACNDMVDIRPGTGDDIAALSRCVDKGDKFRERFTQHEHCLMASINGEVAGYLWFCANERYVEESWKYRLSIPLNAVYSYDIYVNPVYRRKGIFKQLYRKLSEWMREHNRDSIMTMIDYSNQLSLKIHSKIGFRPIKSVLALRILGFRFFVQRPETAYSRII